MISRLMLALLVPLAVLGCHKSSNDAIATAAEHGAIVPCALGGAKAFKPVCAVERTVSDDNSLVLIMHHPDGGFRRLLVTTDGRGVATADGSDGAKVAVINPSTIEVTVGDDRYHLPATVKGEQLPRK